MLSTVTWVNPAGGSWNTAANWDLQRLPAAGDDVVVPDLTGTQTIAISSGSITVATIKSAERLTLSGGALMVTSSIQVAGLFQLTGGTLTGGTIAAGTSLQITGNSASLGQLTVGTGASLNLSAGARAQLNGAYDTTRTLTIDGTLTLAANSTLTLDASSSYAKTQLVVNGTVTAAIATFAQSLASAASTALVVNSGGHLIANGATFGVGSSASGI